MLKSHEKFHSANGKRLVLVADDEMINREILREALQEDYEVICAEDGEKALAAVRENATQLSLVLLDLMMPGMSGTQVLQEMKNDSELANIPVIVLTADQESEIECLSLGAADFIPKPYPKKDIIQARILRTIELYEDRQIIQSTERDELTGLYNREYFYRYAEQFEQHHTDLDMDAVVLDINHFHLVNERYGKDYGDMILRRIGGIVREMVQASGGIVSRKEADTFLVYCPHREDYKEILDRASTELVRENDTTGHIHLRMGIYENVDKTIDMERRFDHAKMAADTIRDNYTQNMAFYDKELHESELYAEQLFEGFYKAIEERQFQVFYQPKYDVREDAPILASAEALVRWQHPDLGLVSPGVFIPLFESNGMINDLDRYVWREAARQIKEWKEKYGISMPVSVNISRVDIFDENLADNLTGLVKEFGLDSHELLLEITESAYTTDSEFIITKVQELRDLGFLVEMDDFGTGYSSLGMISHLPIDALKLDMVFVRNAFNERQDIRMLELILDIADYLSVPVIAEGVETKEQLVALKAMGCDLVQGFYFSKPLPAPEFEPFIEEKVRKGETGGFSSLAKTPDIDFISVSTAMESGYELLYYLDMESGYYMEFGITDRQDNLKLKKSGSDFFTDVKRDITQMVYPEDRDRVAEAMDADNIAEHLRKDGFLALRYRLLVGNKPQMYSLKAARSRGSDDHHIVIGVKKAEGDISNEERKLLEESHLTYSRVAQALATDYFAIYYVDLENDSFMEFSAEEDYAELGIEKSGKHFFETCLKNIERAMYTEDQPWFKAAFTKENILRELSGKTSFTITYRLVFDGEPTYVSMKAMRMDRDDTSHIIIGINNVDAQMKHQKAHERELADKLNRAYEAVERDALTGVKNNHAFAKEEKVVDEAIRKNVQSPFAVAVCDVNDLKTINDTQGHKAGDQYLKEACATICAIFKHSPVYRIGGDEFVALLYGSDYENRQVLMEKLVDQSSENSRNGGVVIAIGMADYDKSKDQQIEEVFKRADAAMYENKMQLKHSSES